MNDANKERIRKFAIDRGFDRVHTCDRLAKAISIEASELVECFLWDELCFDFDHVQEELADVLIYCQEMLQYMGWDEDTIVAEKMEKNERKYRA